MDKSLVQVKNSNFAKMCFPRLGKHYGFFIDFKFVRKIQGFNVLKGLKCVDQVVFVNFILLLQLILLLLCRLMLIFYLCHKIIHVHVFLSLLIFGWIEADSNLKD